MNKKYWEQFYHNLEPTDFAKFCLSHIPPKSTIIDMGCGNGRDSYYFGENEHNVIGIDFACQPKKISDTVDFFKEDLNNAIKTYKGFNVIYSRFLMQAITKKEIVKFVKWSKGLFMAEFRDASDRPVLYRNHRRTSVDGQWFKNLLLRNGFQVLHYHKGRGGAKYCGENPVVVRIIAKKNVSI